MLRITYIFQLHENLTVFTRVRSWTDGQSKRIGMHFTTLLGGVKESVMDVLINNIKTHLTKSVKSFYF